MPWRKRNKMPEETIQKVITENPDSIEFGTPSKGGAIKVYGNFDKSGDFQKKIDNALSVRQYAEAQIRIKFGEQH
jgi:hypothetical protein